MKEETHKLYNDPRFIGFKLSDKTEDFLTAFAGASDVLESVAKVFREVQIREVENLATAQVSPNVMDIGEKLALARRKELGRVIFTLEALSSVAGEELQRRRKVKSTK